MSNNLKIEHYILGKTLGIGAFGKVKLARHEFTGSYVAIKIINKRKMKNNNMSAKIKREIKLLRYFNHPNIIRLYEVLETQSDIFVIMEYIQSGELFELIAQKGKLSEEEARFYFQQIIAGVEYCHSNLVCHRDLKPENILIAQNNSVKVADFGLSNLMKDGKYLKTSCGSPNYAAPEVISGKTYCGTEIDTWSCGVILFALLAGYLPFDEEIIPALFKKIREADYQMPNHFSFEVQDLIRKMLEPDSTKRIKFHDIKLHPWVQMKASLYLKINHAGPRIFSGKINEEIFQRVLMMGFNFENFTELKAREAIMRRKDYSFVIAYDLMYDEFSKRQLASKLRDNEITATEHNNQSLFQNLKEALEDKYTTTSPETHDAITNRYSRWHYGSKYDLPPSVIMAGITETLLELDTVYVVKAPTYRIKCFHLIHKSSYMFKASDNDNMEYLTDHIAPQQNTSHVIKKEKYSKNELVFIVQIYTVQSQKEYVVDVQRVKGHAILFLSYGQKFISLLNKKLAVRKINGAGIY